MKQSITANEQHAPFPDKRNGREELTSEATQGSVTALWSNPAFRS
jgi:hypothetical protein